jgi:hypothetical protein
MKDPKRKHWHGDRGTFDNWSGDEIKEARPV